MRRCNGSVVLAYHETDSHAPGTRHADKLQYRLQIPAQ